jgi:hypothetical protein
MTLTAPDPDPDDRNELDELDDRDHDGPPTGKWHWTLDHRTGTPTPGPRRTDAAALALVAHTRPFVLEPVHLPRFVPAVRIDAAPRRSSGDRDAVDAGDEAGQATAEYALVLLGAAAIALLVVSWATKTNVVGKLLDVIFSQLIGKASGRG